MVEEFQVSRAREVLLYQDSVDTKVSSAGVEVRTGREWRAKEASAELRQACGTTFCWAQLPLGYSKAKGKERRKHIQEKVRAEVEEARFSRMVGMGMQGLG